MANFDKEQFSVLGLYQTSESNSHGIPSEEETVFTKFIDEDFNVLRYDYKKKIGLDRFIKFAENCISTSQVPELRVIYTLR